MMMKQYQMKELTFRGTPPCGSQVDVDVKAVFTHENEEVEVNGFYAGDGIYKVRFYPTRLGLYSWKVSGIVSGEGQDECRNNPDGQGKVQTNGIHFKYEDGSLYHPFGTTIYAMLHQEKELREQTMESLKNAPFNKVRFCIFPKSYDYNTNDPDLFAFEKTDGKWDITRPCFAFWDRMEDYINRMGELGIEADVILFHSYDRWGFSGLSKEECMTYLDYAARRLSALPNVWWSLSNEYELMFRFEADWWEDFASFIHQHDSFGHCLSNHNFVKYWDFSNKDTTHCCIQSGKVEEVRTLQRKYGKPVIFDECGYEGNVPYAWGNLSAFELVNRFWTACTLGGYCTHGETYLNDEEILWWSKGGVLTGESPERIAFLKEVIYSLPGALEYKLSVIDEFINMEDKTGLEELAKQNNFLNMMLHLPEDIINTLSENVPEIQGCYKDEVFLFYNGRQCKRQGIFSLPETGSYRVELIDVWEMTRTEALTGVNGTITLDMPGKEGIAVLCERQNGGNHDL